MEIKLTPFPERGKIVRRLERVNTKTGLVFTEVEYHQHGQVRTNEVIIFPNAKEMSGEEIPCLPLRGTITSESK